MDLSASQNPPSQAPRVLVVVGSCWAVSGTAQSASVCEAGMPGAQCMIASDMQELAAEREHQALTALTVAQRLGIEKAAELAAVELFVQIG